MEKSNRKKILLVALIVGVCVQIFWILISFHLTNYGERPLAALMGNEVYSIDVTTPLRIWAIWTILSFFTIVPSLILNILGWLKNGKILTLIAGILYLIGFNIPSAVLCFIGYAKLKKE